MSLIERIRSRCIEIGDCLEFQAETVSMRKHPQISHGGKNLLVRRVLYEDHIGRPIKAGHKVLPACGNEFCIDPKHQKAMTESQKSKEAAMRGAFSSPARAAKIASAMRGKHGKLTIEQVKAIRSSQETQEVLSAMYGVNESLIGRIRRGQSWKDYSNPFAGLGGRCAAT